MFSEQAVLEDAVMIFLSLYFFMDMDYPEENFISFSILQHYFFGAVIGNETFNSLIGSINKYLM